MKDVGNFGSLMTFSILQFSLLIYVFTLLKRANYYIVMVDHQDQYCLISKQ